MCVFVCTFCPTPLTKVLASSSMLELANCFSVMSEILRSIIDSTWSMASISWHPQLKTKRRGETEKHLTQAANR